MAHQQGFHTGARGVGAASIRPPCNRALPRPGQTDTAAYCRIPKRGSLLSVIEMKLFSDGRGAPIAHAPAVDTIALKKDRGGER